MKLNKGFFITFEGGEGAGKSSLIREIEKNLTTRNYLFISTREPGGCKLSEEIRKLVLEFEQKNFSARAELCLYLASRAQHVKTIIKPALNEKKIVLCDRFNDSTIAYQGHARNLGIEPVEDFCDFICSGLKPDLTIYLDIDPKIGLKRTTRQANTDSGLDRLEQEKMDFHKKVREGYLLIAKKYPQRFKVIDASKSKEQVLAEGIKLLNEALVEVEK